MPPLEARINDLRQTDALKKQAQAEQVTRQLSGQSPVLESYAKATAQLRQKQIDVAVLGGVIRDKAVANGGIRTIFTDYELFGAFSAGTYVFRDDFIRKNPDTVRAFVTGVGKAIEWARTQPRETVVARLESIITKRGRNEDTSLVKLWKSSGVAGRGGVISDQEFTTWIDLSACSAG